MVELFTTSVGKTEACSYLNGIIQVFYGATEPTTTWPFQFWGDTGNNLLKQRNEANDAWINRGVLNAENFGLTSISGWISLPTCTYVSATTFTISGDYSSVLQKGDKIKLTQTTDKYFYVISATYSAPNTTVTVFAGSSYSLANEAITNPYYSHIENPLGFPTVFNLPTITWTASGTAFTNAPTTNFGNFYINNGIINVILRFTFNATSGGTGTVYGTLTGLPAPIANIGCCYGMRYTDLKTIAAQYASTNTRFEINLYDGTTCIANSNIVMFNGSWKF
jgi:hypothetical protein